MKTTVILDPFEAFSDDKTCLLGIEALIATEAIICKLFHMHGCVAEPMAEYGSEELKERREAEDLLEIVRQASVRLHELGISEKIIKEYCCTGGDKPPERIRITKWYRILLPDRGNMEIKMRPLAKTLFILFLRHPEGIAFKALSDYRKEIYEIYGRVSGRSDLQAMSRSLEKLMDPCDNAINISRSRVSSALGKYFEGSRLGQYLISGSAGTPKAIALDRSYVTWDAPTL
ncbi:MAG: hypothetical protein IKU03_02555 [Bacteroidales bacterium]|nr:hypothetical protein [Bacteroidales bacterium]